MLQRGLIKTTTNQVKAWQNYLIFEDSGNIFKVFPLKVQFLTRLKKINFSFATLGAKRKQTYTDNHIQTCQNKNKKASKGVQIEHIAHRKLLERRLAKMKAKTEIKTKQ